MMGGEQEILKISKMQTETDKMKGKLRLRAERSVTAEVLMECYTPCIALKTSLW